MRVLLLGVGGPAGVNFARACFEAGIDVIGLDSNEFHLAWARRYCREVHLVEDDTLEQTVRDLSDEWTLLHAQPDGLVLWLADRVERFPGRTFLPPRQVIVLCQDKFEAGLVWRRAKLREDRIELVQDVVGIHRAALKIGLPMWVRARHGAGARGAILAQTAAQGEHWIRYWLSRDPGMDFVAEEYLPGRDLAWESLWYEGELVASYLRERIEYIYPQLAPSGKTGTPVVARVFHDEKVNTAAYAAVVAIDEQPHGIYSVDLVEDANCIPRPTEINAGRFFTTSYLSAAAGMNLPAVFVRLAYYGRRWWLARPDLTEPRPFDSIPEGIYARHIDCDAVWIPAANAKIRRQEIRELSPAVLR